MSFDERILRMIGTIYEAGIDPVHWPRVIKAVADEIQGRGGALHFADLTGSGFAFGASHDVDPRCLSDYAEHYYAINPLHHGLMLQKANTVVGDHEILAPSEMCRTEVYNDLFAKYGIEGSATAVLANDAYQHSSFAIIRGKDVFQSRQLEVLAILLPHLARALRMNRKLDLLSAQRDELATTLDLLVAPVVLLDEGGQVVRYNQAAQQVLRLTDGLSVQTKRLLAAQPDENALLARLISRAARPPREGGDLTITRPSGKAQYFVSVCPIQRDTIGASAAVAVILNDPDLSEGDGPQALMRAFQVTGAESEVVMALVRGEDLTRFAEATGVSAVTVRNQLKRAMAKLGAHRQVDLVRLVLGARTSRRSK